MIFDLRLLLRYFGPRGSRPASLAFGVLAFSAPRGALKFASFRCWKIYGHREWEDTDIRAYFLPVTTCSRGAAVKTLGPKRLEANILDFVPGKACDLHRWDCKLLLGNRCSTRRGTKCGSCGGHGHLFRGDMSQHSKWSVERYEKVALFKVPALIKGGSRHSNSKHVAGLRRQRPFSLSQKRNKLHACMRPLEAIGGHFLISESLSLIRYPDWPRVSTVNPTGNRVGKGRSAKDKERVGRVSACEHLDPRSPHPDWRLGTALAYEDCSGWYRLRKSTLNERNLRS